MIDDKKPLPVISILGPTASGKTQFSFDLINQLALPCEIINVDSALVYKGMNIGTAKPTLEELQRVPHHLIDICTVDQQYSVAQFVQDADALIKAIHAKGSIPVLVGGTMMYHQAFIHGLAKLPEADLTIRQSIEAEANKLGWPALHDQLQAVDPVSYTKIHPNDSVRITRALEVFNITGKPLSVLHTQTSRKHSYPLLIANLIPQDRAALHARIEKRLQLMFANGFVAEVESLLEQYPATAPGFRCVGYKQVVNYLLGEIDKDTMQQQALFATRQFAKRQVTWLRKYFKDIFTLNADENNQLVSKFIKKFQSSL